MQQKNKREVCTILPNQKADGKDKKMAVRPLVTEILTTEQIRELLDMANIKSSKWELNNHLLIHKGYFISWDGERHEGCIVAHHKGGNSIDHYFMEVELEEVYASEYGHTYVPTYHMLMPISEYKARPRFHGGNTSQLCGYITDLATTDEWDYYKVPMTPEEIKKAKETYSFEHVMRDYTKLDPLTYSELNCWHKPLTEEEKEELRKAKQKKQAELVSIFANGELPKAEDDVWYAVLSGGYGTTGYDFECKIVRILRNRGYSVKIDGERDSFGWVTRGIWIDGKMMCLY